MPRLVVACELAAGWTICAETEEAERDRVAAEVGAALLERLGLTCEVRVLPGGTIPGSSSARRSGSPIAPPTTTPYPAGSPDLWMAGWNRRGGMADSPRPCTPSS